jgi:hypothetical protein
MIVKLQNYNPKKGVEISHLIHPHPASPVQGEELKLPSPGGRD